MDITKDVTATFNLAQFRNKSSATNYATLADALATAATGNELLLLGMQYNVAVSLNTGILMSGGWDSTYGIRNGISATLKDGLTILCGGSKAESLVVKGELAVQGGSLRVKDVMAIP